MFGIATVRAKIAQWRERKRERRKEDNKTDTSLSGGIEDDFILLRRFTTDEPHGDFGGVDDDYGFF
jgi:hypothetical protein